ncbi:PQQ-dependent sugar dehydrogenase [Paracoccus sp. (in: a-proteobacteria)]|uniref:PQQ-dependent sugar dehydrogenase n=1 Tax=Paracoccus sp. TaxID=267 RepID=UPI003A88A8B1
MTRFSGFLIAVLFAASAHAQDFNAAAPNAPGQKPAFAGQTRAPVLPDMALNRQVVTEGLRHPWGMAELPDGGWLVTERPGRLRLIAPNGAMSPAIAGLPDVDSRGQGGLLDVAVAGNFAETRRVWISFAQPRGGGRNATAVATGVLSPGGDRLEEVQVIWQQQPAWNSTNHFGSRLILDGQGGLFVTTGERSSRDARGLAQNVTTSLGKVVRIDPLSGAPMGRPGVEGALPEIWSWGHRNIQGAAMGPDGALWTIEHGPRGGDELNRPQPGRNYGWPVVTYGIEYGGAAVGEGVTQMQGTEQPVYYWDPVIAPGGMTFYDGALFPDWRGDLLIGGLRAGALVRLRIADGRVRGEARHVQGLGRVRDVAVARDGSVMVLTDAQNGALIRLTPGG